jgi:hypothetical protein
MEAAGSPLCAIPDALGPPRLITSVSRERRLPMIERIICTLAALMTLNAFADWPPIVESKQDIEALPASTARVRARGLHDSDIPALNHLPLLKHLDFGSGRKARVASLTDKGLAHLADVDLQHLDVLMLGYCTNITDAGLASVAKMRSITWLSLEVCPHITDTGLASLLTMTNLTGLDLRGCIGITDAGLERLAAKTNWQTIMFGGCPSVTTNGVSKLQGTLPNAKIAKDEREWSFHK